MSLHPGDIAAMIDLSCVRTTSSREDIDRMVADAEKFAESETIVNQTNENNFACENCAENYSGVQLSAASRQARQARGQSEVPPIAVVTASGALEPTSRLFVRTETPPLVFTTTASAPRGSSTS